MDWPNIVVALIGLLGGALAGYFSGRGAAQSWERSRQDMAATQTVELIRAVTADLAGMAHAAMWLTWKAYYDPNRMAEADLHLFDEQSLEKMPRLLGNFAALLAINQAAAGRLRPFVEEVSALDGHVGLATITARTTGIADLADLYLQSLEAYRNLFRVSGIAAEVIANRENVTLK